MVDTIIVDLPNNIVHHVDESSSSNGAASVFIVFLVLLFLIAIGLVIAYCVSWRQSNNNTSKQNKSLTPDDPNQQHANSHPNNEDSQDPNFVPQNELHAADFNW